MSKIDNEQIIQFFVNIIDQNLIELQILWEMIKQVDQISKQHQTWTFNDLGRIFYIQKNQNLFKFKILNILNSQWHESQQIELQRINQQTIKAAFNHKVEAVQYELLEKAQNVISLKFKVKIAYLSTQFCEEIELKKQQKNKQQTNKFYLNQMLMEVRKLQQQLNYYQSREGPLVMLSTNVKSQLQSIFNINLKEGKYLFSITGFYIDEDLYNGLVEDQYDQYTGQIKNPQGSHNTTLKLKVEINQKKSLQFIAQKPNFQYSYEYPYCISGNLDIQVGSKISFIILSVEVDGKSFFMNNNTLSVFPISSYP